MARRVFRATAAWVLVALTGVASSTARADGSQTPAYVGAGAHLRIEVVGIRNERGRVAVGLFDSKEGFLKVAKRVTGSFATICHGRAVIDFAGLKPGTYAVALLHDENLNNKLDTNLIGIPKEGYGFTRDAHGILGPPNFEDAAVEVRGEQQVKIQMQYF